MGLERVMRLTLRPIFLSGVLGLENVVKMDTVK